MGQIDFDARTRDALLLDFDVQVADDKDLAVSIGRVDWSLVHKSASTLKCGHPLHWRSVQG